MGHFGWIFCAQLPDPSEMRIDFSQALQKRKCFMLHAQPARSSRKQGGFYSNLSEMQVFYLPRRAPETRQKSGCSVLQLFRNASAFCLVQGARNPTEIWVLHVPPGSQNQTTMQEIMLRSFRNALALYSRENPGNPTEMQVNYFEPLQKRNCFMFSAGAQKSHKNQGALCCNSILM